MRWAAWLRSLALLSSPLTAAMICVECGEAVPDLYREITKGNLRLTPCPRCGQYADRYVEYELILIALDLLLHLRPAYRHCIHNTPTHDVRRALLHLTPLYILLTLQLRTLRSTLSIPSLFSHHLTSLAFSPVLTPLLDHLSTPLSLFPSLPSLTSSPLLPLTVHWSVDVALLITEFLLYTACVCSTSTLLLGGGREGKGGSGGVGVAGLSWGWSVLCTALLASFPLCWLLVLLVWGYHPLFSYAVDALLLTSHVQAMAALMRCSALHSAVIVATSATVAHLAMSTISPSLFNAR